eukprot:TRINITY_DN8687_c0_g1_i1.p1 TRINITY_DN8687_c0_g1~~TRINITY_DN8687_c0_g1_i1.p1  ORF type:complete len:200 (-),score=44.54 TRINITY_DN8687_c0_g1_i1:348-947(-)
MGSRQSRSIASRIGRTVCTASGVENVLIDDVLGWLAPLSKDFGPFSAELKDVDHEDADGESEVNLRDFNLAGVWLRGKVSADIPLAGRQETPLNVLLDITKSLHSKECSVDIQDFNFSEVRSRDFSLDSVGGAVSQAGSAVWNAVDGAVHSAGDAVSGLCDTSKIKVWICQEIGRIINEQLLDRLGGDSDSETDSSDSD